MAYHNLKSMQWINNLNPGLNILASERTSALFWIIKRSKRLKPVQIFTISSTFSLQNRLTKFAQMEFLLSINKPSKTCALRILIYFISSFAITNHLFMSIIKTLLKLVLLITS
jgi:hypothetical protein